MGLSRSERLVLVLLSVAILAGRAARYGCGGDAFTVTRAERAAAPESVRAAAPDAGVASAGASRGDSASVAPGAPAGAAAERESSKAEISADAPLDINAATAADFERLPGIGPAKARAIVEWRESAGGYRTVRDLLDVPGIGAKTLARLDGLVIVKGAPRDGAPRSN